VKNINFVEMKMNKISLVYFTTKGWHSFISSQSNFQGRFNISDFFSFECRNLLLANSFTILYFNTFSLVITSKDIAKKNVSQIYFYSTLNMFTRIQRDEKLNKKISQYNILVQMTLSPSWYVICNHLICFKISLLQKILD